MKFDISSYVRGYVKIVIADACRQWPISTPFTLATAFAHVSNLPALEVTS
jgi:hypothetical protein